MTSKRLIELLKALNIKPRSYSGRGMYGVECVGVELDSIASGFSIGAALAMEAEPDEREDLTEMDPEWDALGLEVILYFPRYLWPKDMNDAEEV